jgi:tetraacyldisaccharide 4'-kinase
MGTVARALLRPLGWLYGTAALAYRRSYEVGLRRRASPPLPLLSVGALSVGGAGKTTLAAYVARRAIEAGRRPAIILRGYKRLGRDEVLVVSGGADVLAGPAQAGDEAALLATSCPGAVVVVAKRREEALARAADLRADLALLDDGFQYFRLRRDLDLVVVNALQWGPSARVFPAGLLREPPAVLSRAAQIWITYAQSAPADDLAALRRCCRRWAPTLPQVLADHRVAGCRLLADRRDISLAGARALAFCGIGSPEGFRASLATQGLAALTLIPYPDHHWYSPADVTGLAARARAAEAEVLVTTTKDAVRLGNTPWPAGSPPLAVLEVDLEILEGQALAEEAIGAWLMAARPSRS